MRVNKQGRFLEGFSFVSGGDGTQVHFHHGWCSREESGLEGSGEPQTGTVAPQLLRFSSWLMNLSRDG